MPTNYKDLTAEEREFLKNIGRKVQLSREQAGLSQAELAKAAGLAESKIVRIESDEVFSVNPITLYRIATALGVSAKSLLDFE